MDAILAQYTAIRSEIIWVNTTKFIILQAKLVWIATMITIILTIYSFAKKKDVNFVGPKTLLAVLIIFLSSLWCYDCVFEWLNKHINTMGLYVKDYIEPEFYQALNPDCYDMAEGPVIKKWPEFLFWESFFESKASFNYFFQIKIGTAMTVLLPLLIVWVILIRMTLRRMSKEELVKVTLNIFIPRVIATFGKPLFFCFVAITCFDLYICAHRLFWD